MAQRTRLSGNSVYDGVWLQKRMDALGIGDTEVFRRMQDRGYTGVARTNVNAWRTGRTAIALESFPLLCLALDYDLEGMARMTVDHLADTMPLLTPFASMPSPEQLTEFERNMVKIGVAHRKARLLAELQELEKMETA